MSNLNHSADKKLAVGTVTYMIGNMTSKILQILILPIITASLRTEQYGYYDLIITTISLVTPVITLQIIEGMFRFMFDESENEKKQTVSSVSAFLVCGIVLLAGIIAIIQFVFPSVQYPVLIFLNYASNIFFSYTQRLARCQQRNKQFAISGVINTIVMLACQAYFLLVAKMAVDGMLIANAVSYLVASIYLCYYLRIGQWLSVNEISKKKLKELLSYSAPLIPNSLGWWVVASSDRYVIAWFLGAAANGIYSIAGKFSQLLTFITTVFQLAWQESAIMEENSENRDKFYTRTFNTYMRLLLGGYLVVLPFIKIIIRLLLAESYQVGWLYNPILLIGAVFSAFSQFYGSAYLVFKKTSGAFTTTVVAAIINLVLGIGLVHYIGLFAPALGTACSFLIQWILRAHQMREYFKVTIEKKALAILLISAIFITTIYYIDNISLQYASMACGMAMFIMMNKDIVQRIIHKVLHIKGN